MSAGADGIERPYPFDNYDTWIVRDRVLSRLDDEDDEMPDVEPVPHPTLEDVTRGSRLL